MCFCAGGIEGGDILESLEKGSGPHGGLPSMGPGSSGHGQGWAGCGVDSPFCLLHFSITSS